MTTTVDMTQPDPNPIVVDRPNAPFCCYVFEDTERACRHARNAATTTSRVGANRSQAIYEITYGPGIEDYTHACIWHVGPMLLVNDGDDETETTWSVRMVVDHDGTVLED